MKKKIGQKIIMIVVCIFVILNIIWGAYYLFFYYPYAKVISNISEEESIKYTYSIDPPYYLHYEFNIAISENRVMDSSANDISEDSVDIVVWPNLFGETEYGIIINYIESRDSEGVTYGTSEIKINKQGQALVSLTKKEKQLFKAHEADIQNLLSKVQEKWGAE